MVIGCVNGFVVVFVVIVIVERNILERYVWKSIWRRRHHPWLMLVDALQCWRRSRIRIALASTECSPHSLNPTPLMTTIQEYRRKNYYQQQSDSSQHTGNDNGTLVGSRRGILTVVSSVSRRALATWVSAHPEANRGHVSIAVSQMFSFCHSLQGRSTYASPSSTRWAHIPPFVQNASYPRPSDVFSPSTVQKLVDRTSQYCPAYR
jgi:hypothetical protein